MASAEPPVVQAAGLTKTYGATRALDGVDVSVPAEGGVTCVLGPNGAGKTTLISCALGLAKPTGGDLSVFGKKPGAMAARRRLGVMLQDAELPDLLTPREHIGVFATYYRNPLPVEEAIALAGLEGFADKRVGKLSGGQKRRTQFACALVGRPDAVFLDEPTTGLDVDARRALWAAVRGLVDRGVAVVLTTHYLEEAQSLADRIVVMNEGRIVADAPTPDVVGLVGGSLIQCVTRVNAAAASALPGVRSAEASGRYVRLLTGDAVATLQALFAADPDVADLSVRPPSLEEAFEALTGDRPAGEGDPA